MKSVISAVVALLLLPLSVSAQTATTPLNNSASIPAECLVNVTSHLSFGKYDPILANATAHKAATAVIDTQCSSGVAAFLNLGAGQNTAFGCGMNNRRMRSGASYLNYQLHKMPNQIDGWASHETSYCQPSLYGVPVGGGVHSTTIYGTLLAGQKNALAGSYVDALTVSVTF
jgi:spore coat protein U-like protein